MRSFPGAIEQTTIRYRTTILYRTIKEQPSAVQSTGWVFLKPKVSPDGRQLVISTDSELLALTAWMMDGSMTLVAELST